MSLRIESGTIGRPARRLDFQRQYDLNPARCHFRTVFAFEESENHLALYLLSRLITELQKLTQTQRVQAVITSHSPAIVGRLEPRITSHAP